MKTAIETGKSPKAIGPYSQAVEAGGFVFVSGQVPFSPEGHMIAGDIKSQTEQCLKNIQQILTQAGVSLSQVVKATVYMTDLSQFAAMNEVYAQFFSEPYPA